MLCSGSVMMCHATWLIVFLNGSFVRIRMTFLIAISTPPFRVCRPMRPGMTPMDAAEALKNYQRHALPRPSSPPFSIELLKHFFEMLLFFFEMLTSRDRLWLAVPRSDAASPCLSLASQPPADCISFWMPMSPFLH